MAADHVLIERSIPDLTESGGLPPAVAAEIDFLAGRHDRWTHRVGPAGPMVHARALVAIGDERAGRTVLTDHDLSACTGQELTAAAWAVSRVGSASMAETLLAALAPQPPFLIDDGLPLGPRALTEGPLLAATGDLIGAGTRLAEAIAEGDTRAPMWGALARLELARVRLCAEVVGAPEPAAAGQQVDQLLAAASLFFRAGGYRSLLGRADQLRLDDEPSSPLGAPTTGRLREGPTWRVGFGVMGDVDLRPAKGLRVIRHLVQHPGRSFPAVVLDRLSTSEPSDTVLDLVARLEHDADEAGVGVGVGADIGVDIGVDEIRALLFDDAIRSRVGKLITRTITKIEGAHPLLAAHLRATLRTGHSCGYEPQTEHRVRWLT